MSTQHGESRFVEIVGLVLVMAIILWFYADSERCARRSCAGGKRAVSVRGGVCACIEAPTGP